MRENYSFLFAKREKFQFVTLRCMNIALNRVLAHIFVENDFK